MEKTKITAAVIGAVAALIAAIVGFLSLPHETLLLLAKIGIYVVVMVSLALVAFLTDASLFEIPEDAIEGFGYVALLALIGMAGYGVLLLSEFLFPGVPRSTVFRIALIAVLLVLSFEMEKTWMKMITRAIVIVVLAVWIVEKY